VPPSLSGFYCWLLANLAACPELRVCLDAGFCAVEHACLAPLSMPLTCRQVEALRQTANTVNGRPGFDFYIQ